MDKDYYKILEIATTADELEVKKAYRALAMKYHPDKNEGASAAELHFKEVQEAYEVLSHPEKRSAYNQQRWYRHNSRKQPDNRMVSAYTILHKCKALNNYLSTLDSFHINRPALNNYILQVLSEHNLQVLIKENDKFSNIIIIEELLKAARPLPLKSIQKITFILERLAMTDEQALERLKKYIRDKKVSHYWEKFLPLTVLVISIILCLLIYFFSNSKE